MSTVIPLDGLRFGRLTVLHRNGHNRKKAALWLCRCDCGKQVTASGQRMRRGETLSCGCLHNQLLVARNAKHGHAKAKSRSHTYMIWASMIARCHRKTDSAYKYYGARGITVCDRWRNSFSAFIADVGERPNGLSLDRYPNNNGNYEPGNVRWATDHEQASNTRRNVFIVTGDTRMTLAEFTRRHELKYDTTRMQINRGIRVIAGKEIEVVRRPA